MNSPTLWRSCYVVSYEQNNEPHSIPLALPPRPYKSCAYRWNGYRRVETLPDRKLPRMDGELSSRSVTGRGSVSKSRQNPERTKEVPGSLRSPVSKSRKARQRTGNVGIVWRVRSDYQGSHYDRRSADSEA